MGRDLVGLAGVIGVTGVARELKAGLDGASRFRHLFYLCLYRRLYFWRIRGGASPGPHHELPGRCPLLLWDFWTRDLSCTTGFVSWDAGASFSTLPLT